MFYHIAWILLEYPEIIAIAALIPAIKSSLESGVWVYNTSCYVASATSTMIFGDTPPPPQKSKSPNVIPLDSLKSDTKEDDWTVVGENIRRSHSAPDLTGQEPLDILDNRTHQEKGPPER